MIKVIHLRRLDAIKYLNLYQTRNPTNNLIDVFGLLGIYSQECPII